MQRIAVLTAVVMVIGAPDVRAGVTLVGSGAGMTSLAEGVARRESSSGRDWQEAIYLTGQTGPAVTGARVKSPWTNSGVERFELSFDASARRMTWRVGDSDADASFGGPIAWTLSAPPVSGLLLRLSGNSGVGDVSGVLVSVEGGARSIVPGSLALLGAGGLLLARGGVSRP